MNSTTITTTDEVAVLAVPAPQPHRSSTSCDRHPDENFTGFCPSCLYERLSILDQSANNAGSSSAGGRKSASNAIKSLFKLSNEAGPTLRGRPSSSSFLPELRRTKSFSGGKNEGFLGFSGGFEPQRKSCDVRGRNTLFTLLQDPGEPKIEGPVQEEEEEDQDEEKDEDGDIDNTLNCTSEQVCEIVEEREEKKVVGFKTMKDHIDIDLQNKKGSSKDLKELAGSFWSAASVFSKKFRAWTKNKQLNHKMKKQNGGSHTVRVSGKQGGVIGRNFSRDTQSEIAEYGYGRRSCDTDPRLSFDVGRFSVDAGRYSVDAGRISFDDPRGSFDEPRASWDGYLIGRSRMIPPMVSVVEDAPVVVSRNDGQILVEDEGEPRRSSVSINGEDCVPGGVVQTKDYYSDSSSRRRNSLDRSTSIRKTAAAVVAQMDHIKTNNNGSNNNNNSGSIVGERDSRDLRDFNSNSNSLRDDCSESFDFGFRDNATSVVGNGERKGSNKSRRWRAWSIWGLIHRRGNVKDEEDDRYSRASRGVGRSLSESWPELRREGSGDPKAGLGFNGNVFRSNSSVSWRNSYNVGGSGGGSFGSLRKGSVKKKDEFVLERNRSARYSPNNHVDNGMLRFYLAPMKGSRRGVSGKPKPSYSHSFARSVMRFY